MTAAHVHSLIFLLLQLLTSATGCSCRSTAKETPDPRGFCARCTVRQVIRYGPHMQAAPKSVSQRCPSAWPKPGANARGARKTRRPRGVQNLCTENNTTWVAMRRNLNIFPQKIRAKCLLCRELHLSLRLNWWERPRALPVKPKHSSRQKANI